MSAKYFIDTNIFVYCFDESDPQKKGRALALIGHALETGEGIISWQVEQEFLNVATRKFAVPLKPDDAQLYLQKVLNPLCQVLPGLDIYRSAIVIAGKTGYSFYDALILASALHAGCEVLYSEDLQPGRQVQGVQIVNPFT